MRVSSISVNYGYRTVKPQHVQKKQEPVFQGNAGKYIGSVLGFVAITAICPAITIAGLGGLGVLAGLAVGSAVDDKIEESQENKNNSQNTGNN